MAKSKSRTLGGVLVPRNIGGDPKDIQQMTNLLKERDIQAGRAWKANELRLKSSSDLQKLWYVLVKERNLLLSDKMLMIQYQQIYNGYANLKKVKLSMARIKLVLAERKKVRDDYRAQLEQEYIEKKKKRRNIEEQNFQEGLYNELREREDYRTKIEEIVKQKEEEILQDPTKQTPLSKTDLYHYAGIVAQSSQDFVGQYVKGDRFFNDRTYRKIIVDVNKERAQAAKRLFIKELVAVGMMMKKKPFIPKSD